MLAAVGGWLADQFRKWLPDSFIFAILLTFVAALMAMGLVGATPFGIIQGWYKGFWSLLSFAMQMVLILVTGYAIAISPGGSRFIDWLAGRINSPVLVYGSVVFAGCIFDLISWGWVVLTAILARELALRVRGVDYRLLAACVYVSTLPWHGGLSGSIPLLLNTPENFLIKAGVLSEVIPTSLTLTTPMNLVCNLLLLLTLPVLMILMRPPEGKVVEIGALKVGGTATRELSVAQEAEQTRLPEKNLSDGLNNSLTVQIILSLMAATYLLWYFWSHGFDINLDIMNFLFLAVGMVLHKTPVRYAIALKRAASNVSDIVLQFPFYAGIMGIMLYTGLGAAIAGWIAGFATVFSYPFWAFVIAGFVNLFIPSGGGEWAVIGSTIVEAAKTIGAALPPDELRRFIAKSSMAVAYGDSWTNMIQPFWTLAFLPVVGAGVRLQARDFMGYTFVAMIWAFFIFGACVTWLPV